MDNIIITPFKGDLVRLTPAAGYALQYIPTEQVFSEAIVKQQEIVNYKAVKP